MDLEDFDATEILEAVPSRAEREVEQTEKLRNWRNAREVIVSPEVARAIREGWTAQEIADCLGMSVATVKRHLKSTEMGDLIDREARRVMRHLAGRKLQDEKYRDLALALGVMVDKARLLRNEPTEIVRTDAESVDRLAVLLFANQQSPGTGTQGGSVIEISPESGAGGVQELPDVLDEGGSEAGEGDPDGCHEP